MPKKKSKTIKHQAPHKGGKVTIIKTGATADNSGAAADASKSPEVEATGDSAARDLSSTKSKGANAVIQNKSHLLNMSAEIRRKIWEYAVKHDKPIRPKQVAYKSNKFLAGFSKAGPNVNNPPGSDNKYFGLTLTAIDLSLTCHQIYDEIAGACLLYKVNDFTFNDFYQMLVYLVAITPVRANAIRSVNIEWSSQYGHWATKHALRMLSTCEGLRNLKVSIDIGYLWSYTHYSVESIRYFENVAELRGLSSFKLEDSSSGPPIWLKDPNLTRDRMIVEVERASEKLRAIVTQPRVEISLRKIRAAQEASKLNIYGEGRLGPDKKPGIIASRTRGQLEKQKSLNAIGLLQETGELPKFGSFGVLLWNILDITNSREATDDQGIPRVEIYVTWAENYTKTWELLDNIVSSETLIQIVRYYVRNPDAYDIGIVVETVKESIERTPPRKFALESLSTVMKRNDNPEAAAAARRLLRSATFK